MSSKGLTEAKSRQKTKPQAAKLKVKAVPEGMNTVTPHIVCAGAADAIEFYKKAFGAVELMRLPGQDGKLMHACIKIGNSAVMMADEMAGCGEGAGRVASPKALNGTAVTLHLYVEDADTFTKRAVDAGAKIIMPVSEMFWGDRYGQVEDPFGHRWAIASHVRDLTPEEISAGAKAMMQGKA